MMMMKMTRSSATAEKSVYRRHFENVEPFRRAQQLSPVLK